MMDSRPDGKMTEEERARNIKLLRELLAKLEEGKEDTVMFALAVSEKDNPETTGSLWGPGLDLLHLVSTLTKPVVAEMIKVEPGLLKALRKNGDASEAIQLPDKMEIN